jgi:uncharacterized protein YkwD
MRSHACAGRHTGACTLLVTAAVAMLAAGAAPAGAAQQACAAAAGDPGAIAASALRAALRCVVNGARAQHGLAPLRADRQLARAAQRHAADMVHRGYFGHDRPGWTLPGRLRAAGWSGTTAAEAIAYGCGGLGTPQETLTSWLNSAPHRAIVLGRYRRGGVGLAAAAPFPGDCAGAGTWVLDVDR